MCFDSVSGTHIHTNRVHVHINLPQSGLVSTSYEQLAERHDAHVSKGEGAKAWLATALEKMVSILIPRHEKKIVQEKRQGSIPLFI